VVAEAIRVAREAVAVGEATARDRRRAALDPGQVPRRHVVGRLEVRRRVPVQLPRDLVPRLPRALVRRSPHDLVPRHPRALALRLRGPLRRQRRAPVRRRLASSRVPNGRHQRGIVRQPHFDNRVETSQLLRHVVAIRRELPRRDCRPDRGQSRTLPQPPVSESPLDRPSRSFGQSGGVRTELLINRDVRAVLRVRHLPAIRSEDTPPPDRQPRPGQRVACRIVTGLVHQNSLETERRAKRDVGVIPPLSVIVPGASVLVRDPTSLEKEEIGGRAIVIFVISREMANVEIEMFAVRAIPQETIEIDQDSTHRSSGRDEMTLRAEVRKIADKARLPENDTRRGTLIRTVNSIGGTNRETTIA